MIPRMSARNRYMTTANNPDDNRPPWQPGQSGNPNGRPKGTRDLAGSMLDHRAIGLDSQFRNAYFYRAYSCSELGQEQNAVTDYTTAIQINPDRPSTYGRQSNHLCRKCPAVGIEVRKDPF